MGRGPLTRVWAVNLRLEFRQKWVLKLLGLVYIHIYIYISIYVYTHTPIYTKREREREKKKLREGLGFREMLHSVRRLKASVATRPSGLL